MSERFLSHPSVRHVASCLEAAGHRHGVIALDDTARSAEEAAAALGFETGAIVKTLVFTAGDPERPVIALVAGDQQCDVKALATCVGGTGHAIGGVSPVGWPAELPVFIDASLFRFPVVWAAAGHPHCVFQAAPSDLKTLASAAVTDGISIAG